MNWIKVKAEHNTQELSDAQFGSLVRYQLLIARIGRTPTEKEIRRETSIKTLRGAEQVLSSIGVTLDHIESKVIEDRCHVNSKRDAGKERVHRYRDRAKCNALPKQLCNDTDKIREDKIREDKNKYISEFVKLWESYPNKKGRKEAERHFNASVKTYQNLLDITKALENFKKDLVSKKTDSKFIMHGSKWFNNWEDYINVVTETDPYDGLGKDLFLKRKAQVWADEQRSKDND